MKKQMVMMILFELIGSVNTVHALSLQDLFLIVKARILTNAFLVCRGDKKTARIPEFSELIDNGKLFKNISRDYSNPDNVDEALVKHAIRPDIDIEWYNTLRSDQLKMLATLNEQLKDNVKEHAKNENMFVNKAQVALTDSDGNGRFTRPSVVEVYSSFIFFPKKILDQVEKWESDTAMTAEEKINKKPQEILEASKEYADYKRWAYNRYASVYRHALKISPCTICRVEKWGLDCVTEVSADAAIKIASDLVDELKKQ